MAQLLEGPKLSQRNSVPQMHVDAGRVDPVLDAQRRSRANAFFELLAQLGLGGYLINAPTNDGELFIDWLHEDLDCGARFQRANSGTLKTCPTEFMQSFPKPLEQLHHPAR